MIRTRSERPRRGMLTVAVLVCLLVLTLIAGVLLRVGAAQRDETRAQERRLQAEWLAEAGLRRGLARLAAEPGYTGETWTIDAAELGPADAATVSIAVRPVPGDPKRRTVRARADYPRDTPRRVRCTRETTTSLPPG